MILLDEPKKFDWNIKYLTIHDDKSSTTIMEGRYYDFIPRVNELLAIEDSVYLVKSILYDYDTSTIMISIRKRTENIIYDDTNTIS